MSSILALPEPPNPSDGQYMNNPKAYNLAMYRWAQNLKSQLTLNSRINARPVAQNFVVSGYTTDTTLTGTDTGTNINNFICTLVQAMINKGLLKPQPTNQ